MQSIFFFLAKFIIRFQVSNSEKILNQISTINPRRQAAKFSQTYSNS